MVVEITQSRLQRKSEEAFVRGRDHQCFLEPKIQIIEVQGVFDTRGGRRDSFRWRPSLELAPLRAESSFRENFVRQGGTSQRERGIPIVV